MMMMMKMMMAMSTDDVNKETKDIKQNNSKQDLTTIGKKQYRYNALRYLQKDPNLLASRSGMNRGNNLTDSQKNNT